MAGAGFKTFATGDVLTASDVNTYLMQQTVMAFADATARDAAVTSPTDGMICFLTGSSALQYHDGSSWTSIDLAGDITGVTAGTNISGGGTTGTVTVNLSIDAAVAFGSDGSGVDATFHSATAGDYMLWDASDEKLIIEGTNGATALDVTDGNVVIGDGTLVVGADGAGEDVTFHSDTAGDYLLWDSSEEKLILEGTAGATVLDITDGNVVIGDGTLVVGSDGAGADVTFYSDTAGDHMVWDSSAEKLTITGTDSQTALDVPDGNVTITDDLTVSGTTFTYLNVITDSTTTRTPALTDASAYILCTHGSGMTVTLPQDSAVAFPTGSQIIFERNGAGTLTCAAGTGATVNSKGGTLTCADRYTTVAAVKIAADTWTIFGNIG